MKYQCNIALCICTLFLSLYDRCQKFNYATGNGFAVSVASMTETSPGHFTPPSPIPGVAISGIYIGIITDLPGYSQVDGSTSSYSGYEGDTANCAVPDAYNNNIDYYWVCDGMAPAVWTHNFTLSFECGTQNLALSYIDPDGNGSYWLYLLVNQDTFLLRDFQGTCYYPYISNASTRFAILGQLPQTLTLTGQAPFSTTSGMPLLYVYDDAEDLVATETAISVSGDSSQATFPFPSSLQQNGYTVAVANQTNSNPGISAVGTNYLYIASSQTIAGNPFGVAVAAQTKVVQQCLFIKNGWMCNSSTKYSPFPVVTLYSTNQVLIGTATLGVGENPTADATYPSSAVTTTATDGGIKTITTTSGTTRAVVANSGSNTVSILDIVNNVLLYSVAVGNQPVALAVSSDGSTAYVANYTDSTVTQVNLNTGVATATIAVGGHPTSVALTAAGTLWVGGVGFLTQMSTQPMSVVATETVTGKTIIALGFSDSENQLVATTVNTSGNVYVDEINPATFQAGGVYAPLASNLVSSLGTHLTWPTVKYRPSRQLWRART
ncbi:MAG: YncE family protein [Candidatus Micrarchaeaceae archaeon]|jgi:YVTN family beta-propeller protein